MEHTLFRSLQEPLLLPLRLSVLASPATRLEHGPVPPFLAPTASQWSPSQAPSPTLGIMDLLFPARGAGLVCHAHDDVPGTRHSAQLMVGAQEILVSSLNE